MASVASRTASGENNAAPSRTGFAGFSAFTELASAATDAAVNSKRKRVGHMMDCLSVDSQTIALSSSSAPALPPHPAAAAERGVGDLTPRACPKQPAQLSRHHPTAPAAPAAVAPGTIPPATVGAAPASPREGANHGHHKPNDPEGHQS